MKTSAIFWLVIVLGLHYYAYTLGIWYLVGLYVIWNIISIIIHNTQDDISILDYRDDFDGDGITELFLEYPYLFISIYLFFVGLIHGIIMGTINIYKPFVFISKKIDSFKLKNIKLRKDKKKSFSEYKNHIK